jgi:hypothetical protein
MRAILATLYFCALLLAAHAETASYYGWLAFLNTVRTERFDQVMALASILPTFPTVSA